MEQPSFQRRTSSTELPELERTTLHTELAELERPALTTELAQLQTSSFQESSLELSFEEPSFTAQLCFQEASFSLLTGSCSRTSRRRGGVLRGQLAYLHQLELVHIRVAQASPAYLRKELAPQSLADRRFLGLVDVFGYF